MKANERIPSLALALGLTLGLAGCGHGGAAVEAAGPPQPVAAGLAPERAERLAALSLACSHKPWPNKPGHVYHGPGDLLAPERATPAFYGCFDWHSAVHGHWALLRLWRRVDGLASARAIVDLLDADLDPERLQRELAFFQQERNALFERPYGWAWLLRLYAEAAACERPACARWAAALRPLAAHLADRLRAYLDKLSVPVRAGTHPNTAFAMAHALDAARALGDEDFAAALERRARDFFLADRDCPCGYEPSGEDFISPCLAEADLMRRVLPQAAFAAWLEALLPPPDHARFAPLARPPEVRDRHDPRIGHLIGLAFHRAWCFAGLADALPAGHPRRAAYRRLAVRHRDAGLGQMFDSGYGGSHWLASFAIYLLTGSGR